MNQEPTAKHSRRDQDTSLATVSGLTDEVTPSAGDQQFDETEHAQASYAHWVEYPQPIHAGLEQLYAQTVELRQHHTVEHRQYHTGHTWSQPGPTLMPGPQGLWQLGMGQSISRANTVP